MSKASSVLLRARVDTVRYRKAERVFARMGMKTSDAINIFLAQVVLREDMPFEVTAKPERLLSDQEQINNWNQVLGEY